VCPRAHVIATYKNITCAWKGKVFMKTAKQKQRQEQQCKNKTNILVNFLHLYWLLSTAKKYSSGGRNTQKYSSGDRTG